MPQRMVRCAKLGQELPGLDESTPAGRQAVKMATLLGGAALAQRVLDEVSAQAWEMWRDHMRMVMNEYRLDPTSEESNEILREHMVDFLFGAGKAVRNYTPPK